MEKIYGWRTTKTDKGFRWNVKELTPRKTKNKKGQYVDTKIIKTGLSQTRARATRMAQNWKMYFTTINKK